MNKEEFTLLENIKRLDNDMQKEVKVKETKIKILEAEIEQLYEFIAKIQHLGEVEQSYLLEDFDDLDKKIENKIFIQQLIKKANFNKQEMKCIQLFLDGYKVNEINKIFSTKKIWKDVRKKMKKAKELIK